MVLASCITERPNRPKPGITYAPPPEPVQLPPGPIAAPPKVAVTTATRVQVQVSTRAFVRYDGVTLPLVSPDGRYIAVQSGEPPTWEALFAGKTVVPPQGNRLTVYDLNERPARALEWPNPLPTGVMLGRSADDAGFLVEYPRQDGARWIGRVAWLSGGVQWLAQGDTVNAHAVLSPHGALLYTRREKHGDVASLIVRRADGQEMSATPEAGTFDYPIASADPEEVFVVGRSTGVTELLGFHILGGPGGTATPRLGAPFARATLGSGDDAFTAFQAVASVQGPVARPRRGSPDEGHYEPLVIFHPGQGRMVIFDALASSFTPLPPKSIAAVPWTTGGEHGYLCTVPEGLVFCPDPPPMLQNQPAPPLRTARLDESPHVARLTLDEERPVVLFGPNRRDPGRLDVFLMRPASETSAQP